MDGDLIALAKIDDELINPQNTHIHSLLASLMTGQTKFDLELGKSEKAQQTSNGNPPPEDEDKKGENDLLGPKNRPPIPVVNKESNSMVAQPFQSAGNQDDEVDIEDEDSSRPLQMNLLVKEIYRIYEKIINMEYSSGENSSKVPEFLRWSYNKKVPIYLLMVFSE